jgi:Kae1-associated kinase Bud32
MRIVRRGAESVIYEDFLDDSPVLVKERVKKRYRISQIDEKVRTLRTREEVKLLREARSLGIPTPRVMKVDEDKNAIYMELVSGDRLKDVADGSSASLVKKLFSQVGSYVGRLHAAGIVHGDLTTSNMIVSGKKTFMIDFGLGFFSKRTEDKAMDIRLFSNALHSTHEKRFDILWKSFLSGYRGEFPGWRGVISQLDEMTRRVRYSDR